MRIACIAYLHGFGGAERQIVMLANNLSELGHDVHLVAFLSNNSAYKILPNVHFYDLSKVEKTKLKIVKRFFKLRFTLKKIQPDLTINFWFQSAYLCTLMSKSICGKIIYAERSDPGDKQFAHILGIVRWLVFKRVDAFVFQSIGARDYFGKSIRRRSVVIPNAHSIPEGIYPEICNKREKKIISVGRLHPQKNHFLLIESFASIADDFPDYNLEIYGDGFLHDNLCSLIKRLNIENRVTIFPPCSDIYEKMYRASLFILSSDYEGMPNTLMEAMALGVPCISTDCKPGGARALIDDGINGWIVPRNDHVALAEKIRFVLEKCDNVEFIAQKASEIRMTHSIKDIYDKWNDTISLIIRGK